MLIGAPPIEPDKILVDALDQVGYVHEPKLIGPLATALMPSGAPAAGAGADSIGYSCKVTLVSRVVSRGSMSP